MGGRSLWAWLGGLVLVVWLPLAQAEYRDNGHCREAPELARALRELGPVMAVGASVSSGLLAEEFPHVVARQLCLEEGAGYFARFAYFDRVARHTFDFMARIYRDHRPRLVLALDYLYHRFKRARYDEATAQALDEWLARLVLDCAHEAVDCSPGGAFAFVREEGYRPQVLLGTLYYDNLIDCSRPRPAARRAPEPYLPDSRKYVQCRRDLEAINAHLERAAERYPNLHLVPVFEIYGALRHPPHRLDYAVGGVERSFHIDELLFDGFHPWSDPGARVFANLVIERINALIEAGVIASPVRVPYAPLE